MPSTRSPSRQSSRRAEALNRGPLPPTRVKICGITTWEDARLSVDLGASALGFNFYPPSPRAISPAEAWNMIRRLPPFVEAVGVFVDWPPVVVAALARALRLHTVQLHGEESPREVAELARGVRGIKAGAGPPGVPPHHPALHPP